MSKKIVQIIDLEGSEGGLSLFHKIAVVNCLTSSEADETIDYANEDKYEPYLHKAFTLCTKKAEYIRDNFAGKKIAIIYKYGQEFEVLKKIFPNWTDSPEVFNNTSNLTFLGQVRSTREGVNLSTADAVLMYNIDFSSTSYFQIKARMQTKSRIKASLLYWVFSKPSIQRKIYKAVTNKKNFTHSYYKRGDTVEDMKEAVRKTEFLEATKGKVNAMKADPMNIDLDEVANILGQLEIFENE